MNDSVDTAELPVPIAWAHLAMLSRLEHGWNGHGASALAPTAIRVAKQIVQLLAASTSTPAAVIPTNRGGIQLEWCAKGIDIEVEIDRDGIATIALDDEQGVFDAEGLLADNWLLISKALRELS
ncbi:MAG: hypothetical protein Q8K63_15140 [Acidimicrobiales bacterium]|nr:hypothetical protein [Acidimicrobiales bacterium]